VERQEIDVFLTLSEELHFGRTAERLGLAAGRVSQIIAKLERRFGTLLFDRSSRRVALTRAGQQLRDDLTPAHEQIQAAVARVIAAGRGITGTLRVGYSTPWVGDLVLSAADAFRARFRDCGVQVQEVPVTDPLRLLRSGGLDLQFTEFPIDEPDITAGPLVLSEPRALIVPARHPFARRDTVSMEDLARTELICPAGDIPPAWLEHHYPTRTPQGRAIARGPVAVNWSEIPALVAAGRGVSPIAARSVDYHARPGIVFVPFNDAPPIEYGLLWPASGATARVRAFVDAVLACAPAARRSAA
jgi:DNA-binding transcriptional LysR family regulator